MREDFENEKYTKACQSLYEQFVNAESRLSFNYRCHARRRLRLQHR